MIEIRAVEVSMFDEIIALLRRFENPNITDELWRSLLSYPWRGTDESPGLALCEGGKVTGFLGTVFSHQPVAGGMERFCNLTSWYVASTDTLAGAGLLREVLGLEDCTITNLTASPAVEKTIRALGFTDLDQRLMIIEGLPQLLSLRSSKGIRLFTDPEEALPHLDEAGTIRFRHHRGYPCFQWVLTDGTHRSHLIFNVKNAGRFNWAFLHYVSDVSLFVDALPKVMRRLAWIHRVRHIAVEPRLLRGWRPKHFHEVPLGSPRLYRPFRAKPEEVSGLYTELVMLNF